MIWLIKIFKVYLKKTASDKTLRDKPFDMAKNLKYDEYQRSLPLTVIIFMMKQKLLQKKTGKT